MRPSRLAPALALLAAVQLVSACDRPEPAQSEITAAKPDALSARLDAAIDKAIEENRIVGSVVLVAQDGKIVYRRAAGLADREKSVPMREDAIFRLASVSKPFVSVAAMRLVEDGTLALDAPITRWLPDFRPRLPDGTAPDITVRQLLSHTSGLSYRFIEPQDSAYIRLNVLDGMEQPDTDLAGNLKRLAQTPLAFKPGTSFHYSLATDVLGAVIEKATGQPLQDAVQRLVTAPLGIADTGFAVTDLARLVPPYMNGEEGPARMTDDTIMPMGDGRLEFDPSRALNAQAYPSGGAGMVGTAGDVLTLLEAVRTGGNGLLKPETVAQMITDQTGPEARTQGPGWGFGLGWALLLDPAAANTPQSKGTFQWGGVYGHSWFVDPEKKLTVVALTNTTPEGMGGPFVTEVRDAVYGAAAGKTQP